MNLSHLRGLLTQIAAINKRYQKINELTGENFNVFRILKVEASEVRMHSAFIAELLSPNGSHGQRDKFLSLFIDAFSFKRNSFITESCKVEVEKHIGFMNTDRTEGGRIDILVTDKNNNHQIIIENKIYAADQHNQILRCYNHASCSDLFYLTLDGKAPAEFSTSTLKQDEHYKCLSYSNDIIMWLELCRKEVATIPVIRESITQYITLIKYLTNQTLNDFMKDELAILLTSSREATESVFDIINNFDAVRYRLLERFIQELDSLAKEFDLIMQSDFNFKAKYNGVFFWREGWQNGSVAFQLQNYSSSMQYGIHAEKPDNFPQSTRQQLQTALPAGFKTRDWWPLYKDMESPYSDWGYNKELWLSIYDGTLKQEFKERITYILQIIDDNRLTL